MRKAKQSTAKNVMVLMVDSTDHVTGKAGLTLTITASKDGGAFASISPTVTERGNGWYSLALIASHTDTLGDLALHITGTGADPADMVLLIEAGATDADVSTRLATASYTAPDNAGIVSILALIDTEIAAIKARTDALPADTAAVLTLVTKILRNKMITDPSTGVLTVFDDDGVTPLLTANIFKDAAGTTPYDGTGAERRERLA